MEWPAHPSLVGGGGVSNSVHEINFVRKMFLVE